jgi:hypothetical protein
MQLDVDWHRQCVYPIEEGYVRCIEKDVVGGFV